MFWGAMSYEGFPQFSNFVKVKPWYRGAVLYGGYLYCSTLLLNDSDLIFFFFLEMTIKVF